ncbi:MAG: PilZ domain-containing protein [Phycisphaerales bacterium]|nr:PilZ domain-containing protein [Phycisphaerales bacterium]
MNQFVNRRGHERFAMHPMYTPVRVRLAPDSAVDLEGHAYDISEGGVRFELDEAIAPGTPLTMRIAVPAGSGNLAPQAVCVRANVVWLDNDPDEPGPVRMAAVFTRFDNPADRGRLLAQLSRGGFARAA